jgi:hypothetical protein
MDFEDGRVPIGLTENESLLGRGAASDSVANCAINRNSLLVSILKPRCQSFLPALVFKKQIIDFLLK